jgi:hypothetical protein
MEVRSFGPLGSPHPGMKPMPTLPFFKFLVDTPGLSAKHQPATCALRSGQTDSLGAARFWRT